MCSATPSGADPKPRLVTSPNSAEQRAAGGGREHRERTGEKEIERIRGARPCPSLGGRPSGHRRFRPPRRIEHVKIAVIALGKIGLPLAVQFASKGHEVVGVDVSQRDGRPGQPGDRAVPRRGAPAGAALGAGAGRPAARDHRLRRRRARRRRRRPRRAAVRRRGDRRARLRLDGCGDAARSARCLTPGTLVSYETTLPVGTTRTRWKPLLEETSGLTEGVDFDLVFSPERVLTGRVFADLRKYPKLVGGLSERGAAKAVEFYEAGARLRRAPRPGAAQRRLGSRQRRGRRARRSWPRPPTAMSTSASRTSSPATPRPPGIDVYQVIEASNSQPYSPHPPAGHRGRRPLHPGLPAALPVERPGGDRRVARRARPTPACRTTRSACSRARTATSTGARVAVLGAAYRGGVKETAFSGVFGAVEALKPRGAVPCRARPAVHRRGAASGSASRPYHLGEPVDAAVVQADHAEYRSLGPADLPGIKAFIDGRRVSLGRAVARRRLPRHRASDEPRGT